MSMPNADSNTPDVTLLNGTVKTLPLDPSRNKKIGEERIEEEEGRRIGEKEKGGRIHAQTPGHNGLPPEPSRNPE